MYGWSMVLPILSEEFSISTKFRFLELCLKVTAHTALHLWENVGLRVGASVLHLCWLQMYKFMAPSSLNSMTAVANYLTAEHNSMQNCWHTLIGRIHAKLMFTYTLENIITVTYVATIYYYWFTPPYLPIKHPRVSVNLRRVCNDNTRQKIRFVEKPRTPR